MRTLCKRLHRGDDLLRAICDLAKAHNISAGVILSAVGCISKGVVRDASGVTLRQINEPCEIVSLNGTVSAVRCHLHIALTKEDLSAVGGHLAEGTTVLITVDTVIAELDGIEMERKYDDSLGFAILNPRTK